MHGYQWIRGNSVRARLSLYQSDLALLEYHGPLSWNSYHRRRSLNSCTYTVGGVRFQWWVVRRGNTAPTPRPSSFSPDTRYRAEIVAAPLIPTPFALTTDLARGGRWVLQVCFALISCLTPHSLGWVRYSSARLDFSLSRISRSVPLRLFGSVLVSLGRFRLFRLL